MAAANAKKLKSLRNFMSIKPDQEILRSYLRHDIEMFKDVFLVTIHRNWSSHAPFELTELGITTYDRRSVNNGEAIELRPHAEAIFSGVWSLHLRITSFAHLPSATGDPNAYHFGTTTFASPEVAMELLHDIWNQPIDEFAPELGMRPVICMHFGANNGISKMRKAQFDFDPSSFVTNVAVLDAQNIAVQAKITGSTNASLEYLLCQFRITPFDCGNAGNAAMYTTVVATLSALRNELYQAVDNPRAKPGQKGESSAKPAQRVMQWLMDRPTPPSPFGLLVYCTRCGSGEHCFEECSCADLSCSRCESSVHSWRRANAGTHIDGVCVFR